ncbi:MAG: hypothetical protein LUF35_01120 [Lachnospiraceae bacterium]|nr:hypothetical protein [Lachnospiraceae bacterium]
MAFEDISVRIKKLSKDTVAEVQKVNDIRQYRSQVTAEKKRINAMYAEIGKKLYDECRQTPPEGFESEFHSLKVAFDTIEKLQERIRTAKGVALCPNCRMEVGINERFCSNCGCKMPVVITIEEEKREEIPLADETPAGKSAEEAVPDTAASEAQEEEPKEEAAASEAAPGATDSEAVQEEEPTEETASDATDSEAVQEEELTEEAAPDASDSETAREEELTVEAAPDAAVPEAAQEEDPTEEAAPDATTSEAVQEEKDPAEEPSSAHLPEGAQAPEEARNPEETQGSEEA